jgi:tight adherence protein C
MSLSPVLSIALLVASSVFAFVLGLAAFHSRPPIVRLHSAHKPTAATLRELELAKPWHERLLKPLLRYLHGLGRVLTPARNLEQLRRELTLAGLSERWTVIDFLGLRFLVAIALGGGAFGVALLYRPLASATLLALAGFMIGLYLPNFWLRNRIGARQKIIQRALPDALDRMSICVDAGLGFEAAIQKVAVDWENELGRELRRVLGEIRLGVPRVEALHHLVDRTGVADIGSFVAVLVQADRLGVAIRDVLHTQSVQMRIRRRQRAEEAAHAAPIKMLIPMTLFIFPALFAVILGPAIPRIMAAFQ